MLRFLRLIRKKLIEEDHTRKYFFYAIGEIALVMIGILLALQVNNWNTDKNNQETANEYIDLLITDLQADTLMLQVLIDESSDKYDNGHQLMKLYHDGEDVFETPIDLFLAIQNIGRTNSPSFRDNTYNDLVSTGNIKLLDDRATIDVLMNYYTTDYDDWLDEYIYRLWREYFPNAIKLLPTDFLEDAVWEADSKRDSLDIDMYRTASDPDPYRRVIKEFRSNPEMDFYLKNVSRTHLLHIRFLNEWKVRANDALEKLESIQKGDA